MLDRLGIAYSATISLFLYLFFVSFQTELRPRCPRVKVPASEPKAPCSRPDSNKDPSCNGPVAHQIIHMEPNVLLLVWCGSLERGVSSCVVLVTCQRFKMTRSVLK
ncbi:hypothetical protein AVEN_114730-1 [Araneus ventricosus]|uniref:Uncharacterized protein n=1 Tax=Araneus ventricosus TaxID=182803 RepID=A0A4Y2WVI4_ARAVE|nr:hypothetical protein AVEN_30917-1 [Araneus ventricosus]GBO40819.1 hypothetical protein AVEN_71795-1 [Araneus ventricosus]GBO40821.1 hypothetical protein AVEN_78316-1 [Araneus ventricosus]GBO40822.1 hypothetical protein AVEN_114730-1 [Araneus ventricosus]